MDVQLVVTIIVFLAAVFGLALVANRPNRKNSTVIPVLPMAPHVPYRPARQLSEREILMAHAEVVVTRSNTPLRAKSIRHRIRRRGFKSPFTPEQIQAILITLETNHHTIRRAHRRGRPSVLYEAA